MQFHTTRPRLTRYISWVLHQNWTEVEVVFQRNITHVYNVITRIKEAYALYKRTLVDYIRAKNKFCLSSKGFRNFTSIASPEPFCTKTSFLIIINDVATALIFVLFFLLWCNEQVIFFWFNFICSRFVPTANQFALHNRENGGNDEQVGCLHARGGADQRRRFERHLSLSLWKR